MVGLVEGSQKLLYVNNYHCGAELGPFPSSFIIPKGSPLQVNQSLFSSASGCRTENRAKICRSHVNLHYTKANDHSFSLWYPDEKWFSCKLTLISLSFYYQAIFGPDILWLQDTGILKKLKSDELKAPNPIPLPKFKDAESGLIISQLYLIFLWLLCGIVTSILVFGVELFFRKNDRPKGTKRQVAWHAIARHQAERNMTTAHRDWH